MKRRRFLKSLSYASAGAAGFGILKYPRTAHAGWGDWPTDKLDAALEACAREENCGGVSTPFNNASPWVLLGKGSGSWTLESDSYGCTVFLSCPVHGVKSAQ